MRWAQPCAFGRRAVYGRLQWLPAWWVYLRLCQEALNRPLRREVEHRRSRGLHAAFTPAVATLAAVATAPTATATATALPATAFTFTTAPFACAAALSVAAITLASTALSSAAAAFAAAAVAFAATAVAFAAAENDVRFRLQRRHRP